MRGYTRSVLGYVLRARLILDRARASGAGTTRRWISHSEHKWLRKWVFTLMVTPQKCTAWGLDNPDVDRAIALRCKCFRLTSVSCNCYAKCLPPARTPFRVSVSGKPMRCSQGDYKPSFWQGLYRALTSFLPNDSIRRHTREIDNGRRAVASKTFSVHVEGCAQVHACVLTIC